MRYKKKYADCRDDFQHLDPEEIFRQAAGRILIVGAGQLLCEIISLIKESHLFEIAGIIDPNPQLAGQVINDIPVLGWLDSIPADTSAAAIGTPSSPDMFDRQAVFYILEKRGMHIPVLKSARCKCANDALIHKGCLLLENCSIAEGAVIGVNSLLGPGAHVGRHVHISNHTLLAAESSASLTNRGEARGNPTSLRAATAGSNESIQDVIKKLNSSMNDIVLIVNSRGALEGTVTDGDVRRGILAGVNMQAEVAAIMNYYPVTVPIGTPMEEMIAVMQRKGIRHLPVVDSGNCPVRLESIKDLTGRQLPNDAVVMAGGIGSRLRPLTYTTPKPLLNVAGKPILDHILENIRNSGLQDVAISLNYKGNDIREHVGSGEKYNLNIDFLSESMRMGTAGALSLMHPAPVKPFLVMNGDLLTHLNFSRLFEFQRKGRHKVVMCVRRHRVSIPYGVADIQGSRVTRLREKPEQDFFINAGIYVVSPSCLSLIPKNTYFDMPDLINILIAEGQSVGAFPIIEYWRDIGTPEDLRAASSEALFEGTRASRINRKHKTLQPV